jgi:hypothetical protein
MLEQPTLQLPFFGAGAQGQKLERIGVLENLLRQIRILCRQRSGEIGEGLPFPFL